MNTTKKRIAEIKNKLSKTTKQWETNISLDADSDIEADLWLVIGPSVSKKQAKQDAKFMATAYEDIQYLVNLVQELQQQLSYSEEKLSRLEDNIPVCNLR